jgi:hypothetical protein
VDEVRGVLNTPQRTDISARHTIVTRRMVGTRRRIAQETRSTLHRTFECVAAPHLRCVAGKRQEDDRMDQLKMSSRVAIGALAACSLFAVLAVVLGFAGSSQAALVESANGPQLLIGLDDDRQDNAAVQAGATANQSLNRTDVMIGGSGNDVMFGLNGNDVMDGGPGRDIILGGPDGGQPPGGPPNSDIMFGGPGSDVNLWAPGDGSEAFIGGNGVDALIFGSTDRQTEPDQATGVRLPLLRSGVPGFPQGIPTADVSGLSNFCTIEASPLPGYEYLIRFRGATGNIIVTLRVRAVEQVFCSQDGQIAFADLTQPNPAFAVVSQDEVADLNRLVAEMVR